MFGGDRRNGGSLGDDSRNRSCGGFVTIAGTEATVGFAMIVGTGAMAGTEAMVGFAMIAGTMGFATIVGTGAMEGLGRMKAGTGAMAGLGTTTVGIKSSSSKSSRSTSM